MKGEILIIVQELNGIQFKMKSYYDFSFLTKYGTVFQIYDDQDSGNICFGVLQGENKYFIKFAGAPTAEYEGDPVEAINRLKAVTSIYIELKHDNLIQYITSKDIGGGFAVIFHWVDAECMGKQYPKSREKFFTLSITKRLEVFEAIVNFIQHVIQSGYVCIDFYDGSILYDFENEKTVICDIDFFQKQPYRNSMGRMWGSSRFMSPEEYELGAPIDEVTNVFLCGAIAFALFGGELDRSFEKWNLNEHLYKVALKAVSEKREQRYQAISEFARDWRGE